MSAHLASIQPRPQCARKALRWTARLWWVTGQRWAFVESALVIYIYKLMTQDEWQTIYIKRRLQEIGRRPLQISFGLSISFIYLLSGFSPPRIFFLSVRAGVVRVCKRPIEHKPKRTDDAVWVCSSWLWRIPNALFRPAPPRINVAQGVALTAAFHISLSYK